MLIVFFTVATTLSERVGMKDAAFCALVAAFPNTGFMGVPLIVACWAARPPGGRQHHPGRPLRDQLAVHRPGPGWRRRPRRPGSLRAGAEGRGSNPLPWSIGLGALLGASGGVLPGPLAKVISMLGDAASPVALFTIGAVLNRSGRANRKRGG